jgi:hypothetical protein
MNNLSNNVQIFKQCLLNQTNNALTVNAELLHTGNCHELPYSSYEPVILEKD